jgi:uncharacterized membrane protein YczE
MTDAARVTLSVGLAVLTAGIALTGGAGIAGAPCTALAFGAALTALLAVWAMLLASTLTPA